MDALLYQKFTDYCKETFRRASLALGFVSTLFEFAQTRPVRLRGVRFCNFSLSLLRLPPLSVRFDIFRIIRCRLCLCLGNTCLLLYLISAESGVPRKGNHIRRFALRIEHRLRQL